MNGISFIITTGGTNDPMLNTIIDSIELQNIPEYEILIVGSLTSTIQRKNTTHVPFDETIHQHITLHGQPGRWSTRKKNIAVQQSKYDICVVMHDYIKFLPGWYDAYLAFGLDWDICVHQCLLSNGIRGDGWRLLRSYPHLPNHCMIPYDLDNFVQYSAIQGSYWMIKRDVMLAYPMNENLLWGMEEDAEWSRRVIPNCRIKCNPACIVQYLKPRPDDPNHAIDVQTMNNLEPFWNQLRIHKTKNYKLVRE
jgi:hypothetical protein